MMPKFLSWETGWVTVISFTEKEEEQQVGGEASRAEDEFRFRHAEFKIPIRFLGGEVELGI